MKFWLVNSLSSYIHVLFPSPPSLPPSLPPSSLFLPLFPQPHTYTCIKSRELKSVNVDAHGQLIKFVLYHNHINEHNLYNQVHCHLFHVILVRVIHFLCVVVLYMYMYMYM